MLLAYLAKSKTQECIAQPTRLGMAICSAYRTAGMIDEDRIHRAYIFLEIALLLPLAASAELQVS